MEETKSNQNPEMPRWKKRARPAIYLMAGLYVLYMAYQLFHFMNDSTGGEKTLMAVFSVIFLILGLALIIFSLCKVYQSYKE